MRKFKNEPLDTLVDPVYEQDAERYTGQRAKILDKLIYFKIRKNTDISNPEGWVTKTDLEWWSGSRRIASRINELRDDYVIDTKYDSKRNEAHYRMRGKRVNPRIKKPHCPTCKCVNNSGNIISVVELDTGQELYSGEKQNMFRLDYEVDYEAD
jgi:hypothetical protein